MNTEIQGLVTPVITGSDNRNLDSLNKVPNAVRIQSIDLLRGVVMIIMALDHVRDYFHYDVFFYSPTDLTKTSVPLFVTRFITHYCAPVFVFLAGMSAYISGTKKSKKELSFFLWTRGAWLVFAELFIVSLFRSFNPTYPYFNLQVIWVLGMCMIALSAIIYLNRKLILLIGVVLILAHNLTDNVHIQGNGFLAIAWSFLHDPHHFTFGSLDLYVRYPILPWLGIMTIGYYLGFLYTPGYDQAKRRTSLLQLGVGLIILFIVFRITNIYGDPVNWSVQKNSVFTILSFFNVTKYPPSFLYTMITLGPALVFLGLTEKSLNRWSSRIITFGRVPMFYYLIHILLIHILAVIAALFAGYPEMIVLDQAVWDVPALKGYGFNLADVYAIWIVLIGLLYPFCKWFDKYKRYHHSKYRLLSYL